MIWGRNNITGGLQLNYGWVNAADYANLPSGKPANTIGFITATPIPNPPKFKNGTVSGMVSGDVVVKQGITSSTPFNIVQNGEIFINPTGAYQYNGTLWVPVDMYIFDGTSWNLTSAIFYDNGFVPNDVGNYIAYKSSGTTATVIFNADNVQLAVSSALGWAYSQYKVDLTHISKLWFRAKVNNVGGMFAGWLNSYNSLDGVSIAVTNTDAYADHSLDVSAVTGEKYIAFGAIASMSRSIYVNKIWGV
jgi:hypothetical protein